MFGIYKYRWFNRLLINVTNVATFIITITFFVYSLPTIVKLVRVYGARADNEKVVAPPQTTMSHGL